MEILVFTFVQVVAGVNYKIGLAVSDKQEELIEKVKKRRWNGFQGEVPEDFSLLEGEDILNNGEHMYAYLLTCNLIDDNHGIQTIKKKFKLSSDLIYIYDTENIHPLEQYLNILWANKTYLLEEVRKKDKKTFFPQAQYLFELAKKRVGENATIRCIIASHADYEAYKRKVKEVT